jgi:hypothetical protein
VQRKLAWSGLSRRLSGDYEPFPESEEAMIYGAMRLVLHKRLYNISLDLPYPLVLYVVCVVPLSGCSRWG